MNTRKVMKENKMSDEEKWQAVVNGDRSYDGVFLYGVTTTGIFCKPSCKSKTPVHGNVVFFDNTAEAVESGFRACKRCRPDKAVFEPELELVKRLENIIDAEYSCQIDVNCISNQLGISQTHLTRLFKRHRGLTPTQYIAKTRVSNALELLNQGGLSVLEVAFAVGFKSMSTFYKSFKEQTGHNPNEYRKRQAD